MKLVLLREAFGGKYPDWETVVADVCENEKHEGQLYRDGMVYIGDPTKTIHTPAKPEQLPDLMASLFEFLQQAHEEILIASFAAHFYFVYVHPFCVGNGRTARILNASQLYHGGYKKMQNLSLSSAINKQISGYYSGLSDSEKVHYDHGAPWLDFSPFVSYILDTFERCLMDAALAQNELTAQEKHLLERMNKPNAEITVKNAQKVLNRNPGIFGSAACPFPRMPSSPQVPSISKFTAIFQPKPPE